MSVAATRGGGYVQQPSGYRAFIPAPLPPDPPLSFDAGLVALLSRADQAVGRLDGVAQTLPNPDLFVAMYARDVSRMRSRYAAPNLEMARHLILKLLRTDSTAHTKSGKRWLNQSWWSGPPGAKDTY